MKKEALARGTGRLRNQVIELEELRICTTYLPYNITCETNCCCNGVRVEPTELIVSSQQFKASEMNMR